MSSYGLDVLDENECRRLLATQRIGRVAVTRDRPAVFPVLFAVLDGDIVFRTAPGEKLIAAALHHPVAFEVDDFDVDAHTGWSVVVVGRPTEIVNPTERARAEALGLEAWAGDVRDRYVRIAVDEISGRRIRAQT